MSQIVDDQLLGEILRGGSPPKRRTPVFTTGYWYVRLCQAVLGAAERRGVLSGPFAGLPAATRERAMQALLELPDAVGLLSLRDLGPRIGHLRRRAVSPVWRRCASSPLDRLAEQPDATEVQDRHGAYWCDRAVVLGSDFYEVGRAGVLDALDADIDNYRTAFAYLLSTGKVNDAARGVLALASYWLSVRNLEVLAWFRQLLAHSDLDVDLRLTVLANAASTEAIFGELYAGERYALEAVELAAATGVDPPWQAMQALIQVAFHRDDPDVFRQRWEHAHRLVTANEPRGLQLMIELVRR